MSVDVRGRVGFGVPPALGLFQHFAERRARALDLRQYEVRGAVEDPDERVDPVSGNAFTQRLEHGDSAAYRSLAPQPPSPAAVTRPDLRPVLRQELFVCGDHRLARSERGLHDAPRRSRAPDKLRHHVDPWISDDVLPVRSLAGGRVQLGGGGPPSEHTPRADSAYAQAESKLCLNLAGVVTQQSEGPPAHVAQTHDTHADGGHRNPFYVCVGLRPPMAERLRRSLRLFPTTDRLERAIAPDAKTGESRSPSHG